MKNNLILIGLLGGLTACSGEVIKEPIMNPDGTQATKFGIPLNKTTRRSKEVIANENFRLLFVKSLEATSKPSANGCFTLPDPTVNNMTGPERKAYVQYLSGCNRDNFAVNVINAVNGKPDTVEGQIAEAYSEMVKAQEASEADQTRSRVGLGKAVVVGTIVKHGLETIGSLAAGAGSSWTNSGNIYANQDSGQAGIGAPGGSTAGLGSAGTDLLPGTATANAGTGGPGTTNGTGGANTLVLGNSNTTPVGNGTSSVGIGSPSILADPGAVVNLPQEGQSGSVIGTNPVTEDVKTEDNDSLLSL